MKNWIVALSWTLIPLVLALTCGLYLTAHASVIGLLIGCAMAAFIENKVGIENEI